MTLSEAQKHEFKKVKRRLSAIQKMIKMDLKENQLPRTNDTSDFVATSEEMDTLCPKEWRVAMNKYMEQLKTFQAAMANGDQMAAGEAFQKILDSKVSCHKEFRQK